MAPLKTSSSSKNEPIAIIGSGCRFPGGANSPSKLWELLRESRDVLSEIPPSRFDIRGFYHPDSQFPGHANVKHSYLLDEDVADFDAQFFNITPPEAVAMDPQQRLLLETVYEGLESAGLTLEGLKGSDTGVYVGQMYVDYESMQFRDLQHVPTYHAIGSARSIISNRVSYFFDWHGPSLTVDTACSSSLVALHQAVQALRSGEVNVALAAGSNLLLGPEPYIHESKLNMLSPDGRSRMWDEEANGYARGDGVAAIVLKTLSTALADGDNIECIVRETGVNQDGRSRGITMPSATAQSALIRETYAKAGLDLNLKADRCQYFEAHGTGTPAGDPVEAEAVHTAFFGGRREGKFSEDELLVGSIKTIIGHTESTAGLAGVLKVAQAMKHGYIPANLLFNRLNPRVLPFYNHLKIPQELTPWPKTSGPRRASVNSFGFGGTNAHVILEAFSPSSGQTVKKSKTDQVSVTPFLFSAQSKQSLIANLTAYNKYLDKHPDTNPSDLAWTLQSRRSRLPLRVSLPGSSIENLKSGLGELLGNFQLQPRSATNLMNKTKLLGVFTGQGAQWARMGAEIILNSEFASKILADLDDALSELRQDDRPNKTLRDELLETESSSNINQASVSQPLCTAVQVILVELLRLAGIQFVAVVGHSSGEIAAAFTAGYLSAREAIIIAYYRGLHSHLAGGPEGQPGAMLAVGTSLEDAEEICNDEEFKGRVCIAACNSPSSLTLSGDEDAIAEVEQLFEDENKFVRVLKVDKAYHSHHMRPCSQPYLNSMKSIPLRKSKLDSSCTWISSVYPDRALDEMGDVNASYWVENLLSPVLFSRAIERAISLGPFDGAIEVGPHPALKGPVCDTLKSIQVDLPYTGLLQRSTNAKYSLSKALGYLWTHLDNLTIDFDQYEAVMGGQAVHHFISDLPVYQWNHSQKYWHESDLSRKIRQRSQPVHSLLGDMMPQSSPHQLTWKAILRPQDLPWIHHHRIQGQTVFPAAGYAATALETVSFLAPPDQVRLIELENFIIHQAMVFENNDQDSGIEVRTVISSISREDPYHTTAQFTYEACIGEQETFQLVASGRLVIVIGSASPETLPTTRRLEPYMVEVPTDTFYSSLKDVGYEYSGSFKALTNLNRKFGKASGTVAIAAAAPNTDTLIVHPAVLDAAFHSILLAFSYPHDGLLRSLHLPTLIQRIRINPSLCGHYWLDVNDAPFVATIPDAHGSNMSSGIKGDVEIHDTTGMYCAIQVEGVHVVPFTPATQSDDIQPFHAMHWVDAEPNADLTAVYRATQEEKEVANILERGAFYYLRQLEHQIPADHPGRSDQYNAAYLNFAAHTHQMVLDGKHIYGRKEWLTDTLDDIVTCSERFSDRPEIKAMHVVGEQMPRSIRGETTMLEHLLMNGLLDDYYANAVSTTKGTDVLAETVVQIARRYPHSKILEVGAGTGGATRQILKLIDDDFSSYTFTDVSAGFFDNARSEFEPYQDRMAYKLLDLEQDLQTQGYEKHSYDLVVASLVVHATKSIEQTLRRIRSLLKPGGYLILCELTNINIINANALFGCLPGWWQGIGEGRTLGAAVTESKWDSIMRKTGFSGIDTMTPIQDALPLPTSILVSQAVNDWVEFIREPLMARPSLVAGRSIVKHLFIVGGTTLRVSRLVEDVQKLIGGFCEDLTRVESLSELDHSKIDSTSTVLILQDLDSPVFKDITEARLESLKKLFASEKRIVWVTQDRMVDNPYANMPLGFARSALWELPDIQYQFIDFQDVQRIDARVLTEAMLRFQVSGSIKEQAQRNTLWSVEFEIVIKSDGRHLIPRLKPVNDANDRYNSARRTIAKEIKPQETPVIITNVDGRYKVYQQPLPSSAKAFRLDKSLKTIKLSHSTLRPIRTVSGDSFIVLGTCITSGAQFVALTDTAVSIAELRQTSLIAIAVAPQSEALFLSLITANLLLPIITAGLSEGDNLVIHDAPTVLATILHRHAKLAAVNLICTTFSREISKQRNWIHVDRYARRSHLQSLLPPKIARFVDFTALELSNVQTSPIRVCLPQETEIVNALALFSRAVGLRSLNQNTSPNVNEILRAAAISALADLDTWPQEGTTASEINIQDLTEIGASYDFATVVQWHTPSLSITIQPVKTQFKADRTYWLVGLSRDLGISIADYMMRNGAKHLVITSRNPKLDQTWLDNANCNGTVVKVLRNDLTNWDSVKATYQEIAQTLPPVAGIAQGAMILDDVATRDMTVEILSRVLQPKVEGSLNLDRLFYEEPLDFFVFFASAANVVGNLGQASYTAANMFMAGLAQQRRRRGLSASVMDLGLIMGTGYITREKGDELTRPSFERGLLTISEFDVHQTFAEVIKSGAPDTVAEWEIAMGLRLIQSNTPNPPPWYSYPQFACMTARNVSDDNNNTSNSQAGASIKDRLTDAMTKEEIENIITETFIVEIRKMLHLSDDYEITTSVRTNELGLDSLVAVRVRSWFLNNYQVNIPALRILKGTSLQELITQAVEDIPDTLTPGLSSIQQLRSEGKEASSSDSPSEGGSNTPNTPLSSDQETEVSSINEELDIPQLKDVQQDEINLERFGPLSHTQSVFLFVHELLNDKSTLNNSGMLHLKGEIRIDDLKNAVEALGRRHESLRTCICEREGKYVQGVLNSSPLVLEHKKVYTQQELYREYETLRRHAFDISRGQTSRFLLLSHASTDHYLLMSSHHIVFDRASNDPLMADLEMAYHGIQPEHAPFQHLDYSNQQHTQYLSGAWEEAISFWRQEFHTIPDPLPLHRSQLSERKPLEKYASHTPEFRIDKQLSARVREVARKYRSTTFHFHLAVFKVLLHRFLGVKDVCIGIADDCRRDDHMRTGIGPFLNMLPLRMNANSEEVFGDAIVEARDKSLSILTNAIPFEVILNELQINRVSTHTPLAQAFMNYAENDVEDGQSFLGCRTEVMEQDPAEVPYDITFTVINNTRGDTRIMMNVQRSLYSEKDTKLLAHGYEDILRKFATTPELQIEDRWQFRKPILDTALTVGRGPAFISTWPETLVHRFDILFPKVSHRVAVTDGNGSSITYEELSRRIDIIASELIHNHVQPGAKVAIFQHPTADWVASVIAIMKVGAVYVPLDAVTPVARLSLMVGDCEPVAILIHEATIELIRDLEPQNSTIINVSRLSKLPETKILNLSRSEAPAIILYTSGSTGTPKGVVLQHASLKHEFDHCAATYGLGEQDVVLQQSAWSFDVSVTQIFLALGVGARLHIVSHLMRADSRAIAELINKQGITTTYATPTEYKSWLKGEHLKFLKDSAWQLSLVAGEAVTESLLQLYRNLGRPTLRLFNVYGPTETTCGSTKTQLLYEDPSFYQGIIPVGRASANECFYILDDKQRLQPVGQVGEIAIGGIGVAMGYLNNEDRTRVSFLPDSFANAEYIERGWKIMYRTGDLGYLNDDGTLILKGRIENDNEIKLNGVRIDLADIEQTILKTANGVLVDAVASLRNTSDDVTKFMIVHVVFSSELSIEKDSFLQTLLNNLPLPRTMLPSAIISIDSFPRSVAGKVDRRALRSLPIPIKPFTTTQTWALSKGEEMIRNLWKLVIPEELIALHDIDATSDFFSVGGNSMLLIELQHRIREQLDHTIPLFKLFQASTLRSMTQLLRQDRLAIGKVIAWGVETQLQASLKTLIPLDTIKTITSPRIVVITGATGFLGQHLLRALVDEQDIEKIICIANRNLDERKRNLFPQLDRIECYEGDLRLPRLGLSEQDATRIFQEADSVIHNGADVSHLKTFSSLRSANLTSTQELVKLCLPRQIPLHFVSTTGVTMFSTSETFAEVSVRDSEPPKDGQYGYIASKWASEIYLERTNSQYGLPIYIHRPSSIIRPESDMAGENPVADVLQNMLLYSQRIHAVPMVPGLRGFLDLVHPSTVSGKIVRAVVDHDHELCDKVTYIHESGDFELDVLQLRNHLAKTTGKVVDEVMLEEWITRAEEVGLSSGIAEVFRGIGEAEQMNFPRLLRS